MKPGGHNGVQRVSGGAQEQLTPVMMFKREMQSYKRFETNLRKAAQIRRQGRARDAVLMFRTNYSNIMKFQIVLSKLDAQQRSNVIKATRRHGYSISGGKLTFVALISRGKVDLIAPDHSYFTGAGFVGAAGGRVVARLHAAKARLNSTMANILPPRFRGGTGARLWFTVDAARRAPNASKLVVALRARFEVVKLSDVNIWINKYVRNKRPPIDQIEGMALHRLASHIRHNGGAIWIQTID